MTTHDHVHHAHDAVPILQNEVKDLTEKNQGLQEEIDHMHSIAEDISVEKDAAVHEAKEYKDEMERMLDEIARLRG